MKEEHEGSYHHILKYTGIFGGVQGLNTLIGLVRNKIVAYLLGPAGMGLVSLFNTTVNFISQATNLGISFSAVRHVSELFDSGDEARITHFIKVVRAWCLLTGLIGMLVCMLAGPLLSSFTFTWGDHTRHFILLAPAVGLLAVAGGETAILKGARQLKSLAMIQVYAVFIALFISVPIYYFFGQSGIVPVIVLMALSSLLLTIRYSYRLYPLKLKGAKGILGEGMEMVRLGVSFIVAGILGSGAEMLIRSYLNTHGDLDIVGLYNAGYMLTMIYGGMVFSAMETDFFPRLSAVSRDVGQANQTVNRQIEVSVLLIGPLLVLMLFGAPLLIPLLFTNEFIPVVDMMRFTTLALYLRAMKLPVCYMALARGDGRAYLLLEAVFDVAMVGGVILGYQWWGLTGTGIALLCVSLLDYVIVHAYTIWRYHYHPTASVLTYGGIQILLGVVSLVLIYHLGGVCYWAAAVVMTLLSLCYSLHVLRQKTHLWAKLKLKFKRRFTRHE